MAVEMYRDRFNFVVGGYVFASTAAGATMAIGVMLTMFVTAPIADPADTPWIQFLLAIAVRLIVLYFSALFWAICIGLFALLPSSLFIVAAEIFGIRNRFYYAGTASFAAVMVYLIPLYPAVGYGSRDLMSTDAIMFFVAGIVAGLVYWGFAGRDAECRLQSLGFRTGCKRS